MTTITLTLMKNLKLIFFFKVFFIYSYNRKNYLTIYSYNKNNCLTIWDINSLTLYIFVQEIYFKTFKYDEFELI